MSVLWSETRPIEPVYHPELQPDHCAQHQKRAGRNGPPQDRNPFWIPDAGLTPDERERYAAVLAERGGA